MSDELINKSKMILNDFSQLIEDSKNHFSLEIEKVNNEYKLLEDKKKEIEKEIEDKNLKINSLNDQINALKLQTDKYAESSMKTVKLNIGGTVFTTTIDTLCKFKNSFFFSMLNNTNWKTNDNGEYFIDRDPQVFSRILNFLRIGVMFTDDLDLYSINLLNSDLIYYKIPYKKVEKIEKQEKQEKQDKQLILWEIGKDMEFSNDKKTGKSNSACWIGSNVFLTNKKFDVCLKLEKKNSNGWCQIGVTKANCKDFPNLGCDKSPNFEFCYHGVYGKVNNGGVEYPIIFHIDETLITLHFDNNSLSFSVNDIKQKGSWSIPNEVRLLCDIYNTSTTLTIK